LDRLRTQIAPIGVPECIKLRIVVSDFRRIHLLGTWVNNAARTLIPIHA